MKKLLFTTLILLAFVNSEARMKKVEGYYISTKSGRKYSATFLIPASFLSSSYGAMQTEIIYLIDEERHTLTAEKVSEVSFTYKNDTILMRSVYNTLPKSGDGKLVFLKVAVDGPVTLYHYSEYSSSGMMRDPNTGAMIGGGTQKYMPLVLQREGSYLVGIRHLFFEKDACGFFADCPDLVQKIKGGKLSDLPEIVKVYNDTCLELSK